MAAAFDSDNLELTEQFDATTGYEKSVSNLSLELRLIPVRGPRQERHLSGRR